MSTTERQLTRGKEIYDLEQAAAALRTVGPLVSWREWSELKAPRGNRVTIEAAVESGRGTMVLHSEVVMVDDRITWLGVYALARARHRVVQWFKAALDVP